MREIKFRGKRVDNGEWVYGYYCVVPEVGRKAVPHIQTVKELDYGGITLYETAVHEVDPKTVGQYTGLKDKNGAEIYEGDILGGTWENGWIGYCDTCKAFEYMCVDFGCMGCSGDVLWRDIVEDDGDLEVIGNIYETPELLEGKNA